MLCQFSIHFRGFYGWHSRKIAPLYVRHSIQSLAIDMHTFFLAKITHYYGKMGVWLTTYYGEMDVLFLWLTICCEKKLFWTSIILLQVRCEQYWPNHGLQEYEEITVYAIRTDHRSNYTIRFFEINQVGNNRITHFMYPSQICIYNTPRISFLLKKSSGERPREIVQYHYTSWPQQGVPAYATALLRFHRLVVTSTESQAPILVQCK